MSLMQLRQLTDKNKLLIVTLQIIRLNKQKSYIAGERQYQARWTLVTFHVADFIF